MSNSDEILTRLAMQSAAAIRGSEPEVTGDKDLMIPLTLAELGRREGSPVYELRKHLEDEHSLSILCNGWLQTPMQGHVLQSHMLANALIRCVAAGSSAQTLLAEARAIAKKRSARLIFIFALTGIAVDHELTVREGVSLLPWVEVPDGHGKAFFGQQNPSGELIGTFRPYATAAVRIELPETRILFVTASQCQQLRSDGPTTYERAQRAASDIEHIATLVTNAPVAILGSWLTVQNQAIELMRGSGFQFSNLLLETRLFSASHSPVSLSERPLLSALEQLDRLRENDKAVLRIAFARLGTFLREHTVVDKAIDLGIALESLLLHNLGKDRGELTYRMAIRAATFLGGTAKEQKDAFDLIKSVYSLRSEAVHTGVVGRDSVGKILSDGAVACSRIALKIIERGGFPKWEDDFVLRGDTS